MKNILRIGMLLCMFLLGSVGWTMAEEPEGGSPEGVVFPENATTENGVVLSAGGLLSAQGHLFDGCGSGSAESEISVFANGHPVKVYEVDNTLYISTFNGNDVFGFQSKDKTTGFYKVRLYGGSYGQSVDRTDITLMSGAIRNIYGGGRSDNPQQPANVSKMARINVSGGSFSLVCGGGRYYARTNEAYICIGTAETPYKGASNYIMAGGMDQGLTTNKDNKYNSSLTTNVNAVNTVKMDIYGGTFEVIGAGGGNGYTHTGTSTVNINNANVDYFYGVYSNGIADTVNVTINGGSIKKEFASINRGKLINGSFATKDTRFEYDAKAYIGATSGWANSDTNGDPAPVVTGKIIYSLRDSGVSEVLLGEGLDNATIEVRNKLKIAKFDRGSAFTEDNRYLKDFTISEKGNWKSTVGMTFATGDDAATLINNGQLDAGIMDNVEDLCAFVEAGANFIMLNGNPDAPYVLPEQLVIKKSMTLFGNGAILQANPNANWPTKKDKDDKDVIDNSKANLISIEAGKDADVQLYMIHVRGSKAAGINVQTAKEVTLTGCSSKNNATAGLLVHAPVVANGFQTAGNVWGGVNVDKGNNGSDTHDYNPSFQFDSRSTFAEDLQIWAEAGVGHIENPTSAVILPDASGASVWNQKTSNDGKFYVWSNAVPHVSLTKEKIGDITYVYANGNIVNVASAGEGLTKITSGTESFTFSDSNDKVYLFGGSKDASVENTSITMTGGKLTQIYGGGLATVQEASVTGTVSITMTAGSVPYVSGGGYGKSATSRADVKGKTTIKISGGTISGILAAAGDYYAKSGEVEMEVTGAQTSLGWVLGGGFAASGTSNTLETTFDNSVNGTSKTTMSISEASADYICAGGGQGYSYSKEVVATLNGVKIIKGLLGTGSNGRSDKVLVYASNCDFTPNYDGTKEVAAINRGFVTDSVKMVFENCTFPTENLAVYACATLAWQDGNYPTPTTPNTEMVFTNCENTPTVGISEGLQNFTLTGANAKMDKFTRRLANEEKNIEAEYVTDFTIPAGNTWSISGDLSITNEVTSFTNKGTIVIPATSVHAVASKAGGNIVVSPATTTMNDVVTKMNVAEGKSDLQTNSFSIECQDGVIASNKSVAAELAAMGKLVKVLSFDENNYSLSEEAVQEAAKITNLPDSVAYGTQPITLAFNRTDKTFTATIEDSSSEVARIETPEDNKQVLTILKPGEVTIKLSSGSEESAETYTQKLKVTKRIVTLTSGLEVDYASAAPAAEGNEEATTAPTSKVYDGSAEVTVKMTGTLTFAGKLGSDAAGLSLADYTSGTMADANVGEGKLVTIANAKLVSDNSLDSTAYYELAPITIVKATVTPKPITITATDKSVAYGGTIEYAVDNYSSSLVSGDKLDGTLKFSCAVSTDTTAQIYEDAIQPYGLTSPNYAIKFAPGNLTVTAIAPSIEITEAKVVTANANKNIELKARLIHNGGAETDPTVSFSYGSTSVGAEKGTDGLYAATISAREGTTYDITASATVGGETGTSSAVSVTIDARTPQNLTWAPSVLPTLVYGQTMTIAATSDQAAANGAYTYRVVTKNVETPIASITGGVLKARKVGKVTITAERADDDNYSVATLTKTIEITPKPITVSVSGLDKVYDGTTTIGSPIFTLTGVESGDDVSVNKANLTLSYASKNAGDNVAVILPELTLTGADAANYTLVQPKNVTGKITKPRLTIKVKDVTRLWNQRHTKYEFETDGLMNGETLAQAYSGTLAVAEEDGVLILTVEANKSQNYDVTAENGTLTITKGMPKAVVYGSENLGWNSMIVDYQGYDSNDLTLDNTNVASGGKALVKLNGTVLTSSINSKPTATRAASLNAASFSLRSASLRAETIQWDSETFNPIAYGAEAQGLNYPGDTYTYESTNMSVLTYADGKITPVGVGNATIIATSTGGTEVHICNFTVKPKSLGMTATEMDKTYDGTAIANGTVSLDAGDIVGTDDVALDLSGITFNYADKNVADGKAIVSSQNLVLIGTNANNYTLSSNLAGNISKKEITVNGPIAVYYNGQKTHTLTTYPATGLVAGDVAPITVTFASAAVGTPNITIALTSTDDAANYTLSSGGNAESGTIQRSTLVATLPANASSVNDLKNNITLAIRETGEAVTASAVGFVPTITPSGSGDNTVYSVTGGETTNYSVVYNRNQIGYAAAPVIPGGGGGGSSEPETPETPTTPDTPTGVESISEGSQLYTVKGAVVVSPAEPLQVAIYSVTGQTLFNDEVSYLTQVPAKAGIYVVVIQKGKDRITEKVFVK